MIQRIVVGKFAVNCYMLMDDETKEAMIIDPGDQANLIERSINEHGAKVKYIVLTHGHADHIGAAQAVKEMTDAQLIASSDDQDMLLDAEKNESLAIFKKAIEFDADYYVRDKEILSLGSLKVKVITTPGHTKGGICLLVDDVLFTGDTLFQNSIGRSDLYGGDHNTLLNAISSKLMVLSDDIQVLPGHGGFSTIGHERKHNPYT